MREYLASRLPDLRPTALPASEHRASRRHLCGQASGTGAPTLCVPILCHGLCHNPAIPAGVGSSSAVSLGHT
jgi:hypothetical protein